MPNWVLNVVRFNCDDSVMNDIKNTINNYEGHVDFDRIVHMPESLNLPEGSSADKDIECFMASSVNGKDIYLKDKYRLSDEEFEKARKRGEQYTRNKIEYGYRSWYDWRWANWGTKWNASDTYWNATNIVQFTTAWSCPVPIFEKISEKYPDVKFEVAFADEDLGNNCGVLVYENGRGEEISCFDEESAEKFAEDLWNEEWYFEGEEIICGLKALS